MKVFINYLSKWFTVARAFLLVMLLFIISLCHITHAQWSYTELASMPEPVSNNAVTSIEVDGKMYIYSFSGIDSTKLYSGIHKRCFKYDVQADIWSRIPDLPNGNGRIAAGASVINGKIYIVGGYEVMENGSELSFRKMHVFDPVSDTFLADARDLFYPIDDHVQVVWRDSLLYLITGWSNFNNVNIVQLYDSGTDSWSEASRLPDNNNFKVFGGSGCIVGDTIYYAGGASDAGGFPATSYFRKGVIDAANPSSITWSGESSNDALGYRMAASNLGNDPIWFGGSDITYNYDGIAYNGSGGVLPFGRIKQFNTSVDSFLQWDDVFPPHMDYRGLGKVNENSFILAGGMGENQEVSSRVFLIQHDENSNIDKISQDEFLSVHPNPFHHSFKIVTDEKVMEVNIYNQDGKLLAQLSSIVELNYWPFPSGIFYLDILCSNGKHVVKKIIRK